MGRKDDEQVVFLTTTEVNIREGAGTQFATLTDSLPKKTRVQILKRQGNWSFVEVLEVVNGLNDLEGWVFSKYLVDEQ